MIAICFFLFCIDEPQGLVTIHVNILSMYKHVQGRTSFLPRSHQVVFVFLNSF